jgi:hypothetical protein
MNSFSNKIAKVISLLFNPFLMPSFGILLIFFSGSYLSAIPYDGKKMLFTIIFAGTFLIPLSFLPLFLHFRIIDDINITDRKQRLLPLIITGIIYFCTFYYIRHIPIPFINIFLLGSTICIIINAIIISWWKISSHLIGVGGLVGVALGLIFRMNANMPVLLICCILIAGFVGFARLQLKAHTPAQVYIGFFLGFFIMAGLMFW